MEKTTQVMIYEHIRDMKNHNVSLDEIDKRVRANYKTYRKVNPRLEPFEAWSLMCVEVYDCVKGEAGIKGAWDEFQADLKKGLGKKRFKKRKK